jgi:hypothetical protein
MGTKVEMNVLSETSVDLQGTTQWHVPEDGDSSVELTALSFISIEHKGYV